MSWVIALLLGLILVAMISSNQLAAAGVTSAIKAAFFTTLFLILWSICIGYSIWYHDAYKHGEWTQIFGIGAATILPPILLIINRKSIVEAYKKDKKNRH